MVPATQQTTSRVAVPIALKQGWLWDLVRHVLGPKVADAAIEADIPTYSRRVAVRTPDIFQYRAHRVKPLARLFP